MTFITKLMTSQTCLFTGNRNKIIQTLSCIQLLDCYLNLHLKFVVILSKTYNDMTQYPHMYQNVHCNLLQKNNLFTYIFLFVLYHFAIISLRKRELDHCLLLCMCVIVCSLVFVCSYGATDPRDMQLFSCSTQLSPGPGIIMPP